MKGRASWDKRCSKALGRRIEHDDLIVSPEVTEFYAKALPCRMDDFTYCLKFDPL